MLMLDLSIVTATELGRLAPTLPAIIFAHPANNSTFRTPEWLTVFVTVAYSLISFFTLMVLRKQAELLRRQTEANEISSSAAADNARYEH